MEGKDDGRDAGDEGEGQDCVFTHPPPLGEQVGALHALWPATVGEDTSTRTQPGKAGQHSPVEGTAVKRCISHKGVCTGPAQRNQGKLGTQSL